MRLSPKQVIWLLAGGLAITDVLLSLTQVSNLWLAKVLALICLLFLPGAAALRALRFKTDTTLEMMVYSFGLSILTLMISGLAANQILPLFGVDRPLELAGVWGTWNIVVIACIVAARRNRQTISIKRQPLWSNPPKVTWLLLGMSSFIPVVATFGAFRLNNGSDALVAEATLCLAAVTLAYAFLLRKRLSDNVLAWTIFTIGLGILLMTSMRSWDISGHDLAREFHIYTLTHLAAHWDISAYRDPYNACLSISVLPEALGRLLHISGLTVFRLILQIIFAICPVVIYCLLRRFVSKLGALVGCGLFLSYPTFINDSAMLTRQGVAYLFFALAVLAVTSAARTKTHKILFLLSSLGVILSHYSTAYMFVALFAIALVCKLILQRLSRRHVDILSGRAGEIWPILSPTMLLVLLLATFMWYSQITATSGGLVTTLSHSATNIPHLLSDDNKSSDTSAALLLAAHKSQVDLYQSYLAHPVQNNDIVNAAQYRPEISSDNVPITALGKRLRSVGVQPSITTTLRQNFGKILQLLAGLGVIYTVFQYVRKRSNALPLDLICLSMAGIVLLVFMVVLPNLSVNYGVLRSFQQSLIFLVVPIAILLSRLMHALRPQLRTFIAAAGMAVLFLLFTSFIGQIVGGSGATLSLNNRGLYYGLYYTTQADLRSFAWMKTMIPAKSDVRAASHAKALMHDPTYPFDKTGILPTQRPNKSFVYLNQAQTIAQKFYVYQQSSPLIMTFPMDYYNEHANQIYSTATTGVYR